MENQRDQEYASCCRMTSRIEIIPLRKMAIRPSRNGEMSSLKNEEKRPTSSFADLAHRALQTDYQSLF